MDKDAMVKMARQLDHLSIVLTGACYGDDCEIEADEIMRVLSPLEDQLAAIIATTEGKVTEDTLEMVEGK
jgi:hypothetical protein